MPCKPLYRLTHTLYSHNFALEGAIFALEAPYLLFALLLMKHAIYCDNNAATRLAEDQVLHSEVKHIRVKLHTIRDYIALGDVQVPRV